MNGDKFYLADTNFITHLNQKNPIIEPFLEQQILLSFVSEMELLGVFSITKSHVTLIENILSNCIILDMNLDIKKTAIKLKQKYKVKLPDAIIAATALYYNLPFITSDADFKKISELNLLFLEK